MAEITKTNCLHTSIANWIRKEIISDADTLQGNYKLLKGCETSELGIICVEKVNQLDATLKLIWI